MTTKTKATHTPGPWCVTGDYQKPSGHILYNIAGSPNEDFQANARLIAAAPDLLEVCKESLERIREYEKRHNVTGSYYSCLLEAVIAKAEGKEAN